MRSLGPLWLLCCALLAGCASEGGVTGTGISASVTGNIAIVSDGAAAAVADLPFPISVTIDQFPGITGTTDAEGAFALAGVFSGAVTLQFANAATGAPLGPLVIDVPPGSSTVLENIEIRISAPPDERVRPGAVRQFDVFGRLDMVECGTDGGGVLLLSDDGRPPRQLMVRLTADTDIASRDGEPLGCADLQRGLTVRVEGLLRLTDQTIVAVGVVVAPVRPPRPEPGPRPERLRGTVTAIACPRGLVEVEQFAALDPIRRVIRLGDDTEIRCATDPPTPCMCADIRVGDSITVGGTVQPARPGIVDATVVVVGMALERVTLVGVVAIPACATGTLELRDPQSPARTFRVRLLRATEFVCGRSRCMCVDLRPRDRVRVDGVRPIDSPQPIEAERITRLPRPRAP